MKLLTHTVFLLLSCVTFGQEIDPVEAQLLWETNITAILEENHELIVDQTEFPLNTFYGDLTSEEFRTSMNDFFTQEVLEDIRQQTPADFQVVVNADGITAYMLVIMTTTITEDGEFESATILSFKKELNGWKLYHIDVAG